MQSIENLLGRVKQPELTLQRDEPELLRLRQDPPDRPLEPLASAGSNAIVQLCAADDAATLEFVGQLDASFSRESPNCFERPSCGAARAGLNEECTAVARRPTTILNVLVAMDNQPGPRLTNNDDFHAVSHCRPARVIVEP
jgi:hypothetical protein